MVCASASPVQSSNCHLPPTDGFKSNIRVAFSHQSFPHSSQDNKQLTISRLQHQSQPHTTTNNQQSTINQNNMTGSSLSLLSLSTLICTSHIKPQPSLTHCKQHSHTPATTTAMPAVVLSTTMPQPPGCQSTKMNHATEDCPTTTTMAAIKNQNQSCQPHATCHVPRATAPQQLHNQSKANANIPLVLSIVALSCCCISSTSTTTTDQS